MRWKLYLQVITLTSAQALMNLPDSLTRIQRLDPRAVCVSQAAAWAPPTQSQTRLTLLKQSCGQVQDVRQEGKHGQGR
jgi:hypothetical protein